MSAVAAGGRTRVLFICGQNSARSQMAEAWLDVLAGDRFEAHSAGLEPAPVNPLAVAALAARGQTFDAVITVCTKAAGLCPVVPGVRVTERWSFDDPGAAGGSSGERLELARRVRDEIEQAVRAWIAGREEGDRA